MRDITFCSPTKLRKKCATCYRRKFFPEEQQSWSNFYDECDTYYMQTVSPSEYSKRMDKIIAKGGAVNETLIALLDEANKYHIESELVKSGFTNKKKGKHETSQIVKRVRK